MTALIYKAALPTYTSAEALNANAGESLLLNDAGTAYELEPAQGGASEAPLVGLYFTIGDRQRDFQAGYLLVPKGKGGTLNIGPVPMAGSFTTQPIFTPQIEVPEGVSELGYYTLWVSNTDCTQTKTWYAPNYEAVPVTPGPIRDMLVAEWSVFNPDEAGVGISMHEDGSVWTTVPGVYWASMVFYP